MKVGKKYLCKNGFIANIKTKYKNGGFGGDYEDEKGEIVFNRFGYGWAASYDKNGFHPNENLQVVKKINSKKLK